MVQFRTVHQHVRFLTTATPFFLLATVISGSSFVRRGHGPSCRHFCDLKKDETQYIPAFRFSVSILVSILQGGNLLIERPNAQDGRAGPYPQRVCDDIVSKGLFDLCLLYGEWSIKNSPKDSWLELPESTAVPKQMWSMSSVFCSSITNTAWGFLGSSETDS